VTSSQGDPLNATSRFIGVVPGNNPSGVAGWTWRRVGDLQCDGKPIRLVIAAYNDDNLPRAYFDIDRVMFVPSDKGAPELSPETNEFNVILDPFEDKPYTIVSSLGKYRSKRIDIELFDTASGESRNIFFVLRANETSNVPAP
jgi:hypothetical protein